MDRNEIRRAIAERCDTVKTHHARWNGRDGNTLVREPLPLDDLPERFGVYPVAPGSSETRVGVLDLDNHGDPPLAWDRVVAAAAPVVKHLRAMGHRPMPFRSTGGRGLHVWLVWDEPQSAERVRALLTSALEACALEAGGAGLADGQVEVFPKQASVPVDGVGSCVDPPLAGRSVPLNPKDLSEAAGVMIVSSAPLLEEPTPERPRDQTKWDVELITSALDVVPADDYDVWVDVLRALKGGAKRAKAKDEDARAIAYEWSKRSGKHTDREFAYKWDKGLRKEAAGRGRTLGTLFWLAEHRFGWERPAPPCPVAAIRIQASQPPLYLLTMAGFADLGEVKLTAEQLFGGPALFRQAVGAAINRYVHPPKPKDLNQLLAVAEYLPADEDATELGKFRGLLLRYLDDAVQDDRGELALEGRAWTDERGRTWFKWADLDDWLRRHRRFDWKHESALYLVRQLKGDTGTVHVGGATPIRAWWVPIDPRAEVADPPEPTVVPPDTETPF